MIHRFIFSSDPTSEPEVGRIFHTDTGYTGKVWREDDVAEMSFIRPGARPAWSAPSAQLDADRSPTPHPGPPGARPGVWHACLRHACLPDYSLKTILNTRPGYHANATGATMKEACERSIERFEQL
jgi:hypothetical protein